MAKKSDTSTAYAQGLHIGVALGLVASQIFDFNLGLGIAFGAAFGGLIGMLFFSKAEQDDAITK
jgi:membrane associated rhomboid family serine protease